MRVVVDWAQSKYVQPWQKDALRRVVEQSSISDADRTSLIAMIEVAAGLRPSPEATAPRSLMLSSVVTPTSATVTDTPSLTPAIILGRIHSLQHVNALATEQQLTFGETGITLIYGENGAGKTGYSRVLRRACRQWREKDVRPILSSVRQGAPTGTPEAKFDIRDTNVVAPRSVRWVQGATPPPELAGFAIFDGSCVRPLIAEENIISYQPQALGIIPAFADVLVSVQKVILGRITSLRTKPLTIPQALPTSLVGAYIARLDSGATLTEFDSLIGNMAENENRLTSILQDLALLAGKEGPESQAQTLDRVVSRAEGLRGQLLHFVAILDDEAVQKIADAERDHRTKRSAAHRASHQQFQQGFLPGTGTADEWRCLYEAAKAFSEQFSYKGKRFPVIENGAQCPFCQQTLDSPAITRLQSFQAFVEDRTATDAANAHAELERHLKPLRVDIADIPQADRDEFRGRSSNLGTALDAVAAELRQRKVSISRAAETGEWNNLPPIITSIGVIPLLVDMVSAIKAEAATKRDLIDPVKKKALEIERDSLVSKLALHKVRPDIARYLEGRKTAKSLEDALGDCSTNALSTQNGKYSEQFITRELAIKLNEELRLLGVETGHLAVEFKTKTERGITRNSLALTGTNVNPKEMHEVLSEGEQRVLAIAAFVAELRLSNLPIGIIFDDPVTSLDHRWADRISERLVRLGEDRQVIIFTHHISFSYLIKRHAENIRKAPLHEQFIRRINRIPGHCSNDPIWEFASVSGRKAFFNNILTDIRRLFAADPDSAEYELAAAHMVSALRVTWERVVEEVLLNGTIQRFEPSIRTTQLRQVAVENEDFAKVYNAMTSLSAYPPVHDKDGNHVTRRPNPNELEHEYTELYKFVGDINKRKETLGKSRALLVNAPLSSSIMKIVAPVNT